MSDLEWRKQLSPVQCELSGDGEYVVSTGGTGNILIHWAKNGNVFKLHGGRSFQRAIKNDFFCKHLPGGWFLFDKSMWPNVAKWIAQAAHQNLKQIALSKAKKEVDKLAAKLKGVSATKLKSEGYRRNGQEVLRKYLLLERGRCEVSSINFQELLVVSHIRPWRDCGDSVELRLDPENVLLLAANWDALFDKKYISFDPETGRMIKARRIDEETLRKFGVPDNWQTSVKITINTERRKDYLRWHKRLMAEEDMLNNAKRSQSPSS